MNPAASGALARHYPIDVGQADEAGKIGGLADAAPLAKAPPPAAPVESEAALPYDPAERDPVLLMVGGVLGERLTTDNLAWRGDPVPVMRSLQKMLVAHSLTLPEDGREPAMAAIRTVELAVRWRLRWMQMRRSEAESHFIQPQRDDDATQKSA